MGTGTLSAEVQRTCSGQWQEKAKGALVWKRDESPNQIRKQTWVEKGWLTPDVLNFPERHHCVSPAH